jgi:hypothetical protein
VIFICEEEKAGEEKLMVRKSEAGLGENSIEKSETPGLFIPTSTESQL